jgi:hypothetical protein
MFAWEIAYQWQQENSITPFEEILGWHFSSGIVHSTPSVFILAHEVTWDACSRKIIKGTPNAWFVELAASACHATAVHEFFKIAPHPHQWALWCRQSQGRKHDIHDYRWEKLAKRLRLHPA